MTNKTIINSANINLNSASSQINNNYENSFHCSNDKIYTPVYIEKTPSKTPGFENPIGEHIGPTSKTLNPYYSLGVNMDYSAVCHDDDPKNLSPGKKQYKDIKEFRTMGFRGPMILSGYGYDICDQPVPNDGNDSFNTEVSQNRKLYKTGPIDLKWDDDRKVWGSGVHIVEGILLSNITAPSSPDNPTEFQISVRRGKTWEDKGEIITCHNRDTSLSVNLSPSLSIFVMVNRINYQWRPCWIGCGNT